MSEVQQRVIDALREKMQESEAEFLRELGKVFQEKVAELKQNIKAEVERMQLQPAITITLSPLCVALLDQPEADEPCKVLTNGVDALHR